MNGFDHIKKRPGPVAYRTFYTAIGFQISKYLHQQIKEIAFQRRLRIEDVYAEATIILLQKREEKKIIYIAAPQPGWTARMNVKMHDELRTKARLAAATDGYRLNDFLISLQNHPA
jgi:hypothetical protein